TIGMLVARKLGVREAVLYILSQIVGAVIGAAVVYATISINILIIRSLFTAIYHILMKKDVY
ncbi:MAG TPA: aquaporin, partial [Nitrososphaeraceae archaeon]|nr:aquaporin [Nitrososphaeraceae archaeon]